jgi:galactan endo-1,6-beta-galactosidase
VNFTTVEAFNEPIATWWKADGTHEGCHFDAATQAAVLAELPAALAAAGVAPRIAASDESRIDMAISTWGALGPSTRALIDQFNVHGYQEGGDRAGLYDAVVVKGGKVLHDSEYGDGDGTGGESIYGEKFADGASCSISSRYFMNGSTDDPTIRTTLFSRALRELQV